MKRKSREIIAAILFALMLALTGMSGIAFAEPAPEPGLEPEVTEPEVTEPEILAEADIVFTIKGDSGYGNWLFLPQWIPVTDTDLLLGITAVDENGDPVAVTVADVGGLNLKSPQPQDGFPPTPYVITYEAVHPVTGEVFTITRDAFVTVGIQPLAIDSAIATYTVYTGPGPTSATSSGSLLPLPETPTPPPPAPSGPLDDGEVQVSKTVTYNYDVPSPPGTGNPDGTVTITLYAWANTFTYTNNAGIISTNRNPLVPMANGNVIEITDDVGEFFVIDPLSLPPDITPVTDPATGRITSIIWNITNQAST